METYVGQLTRIATTATMVSPFPALYIAIANNGNSKPANDRKKQIAASTDHKRVR
jgi:hypothetical protein